MYNCIPVIMVSAKGKEENIVEGLNSGSNDYITKPFGREEILARIKAHLRFRDAVYAAAAEMAGEWFVSGRSSERSSEWAVLEVEGGGAHTHMHAYMGESI